MTVSASATSVPPGGTLHFRIFASAGSWEPGEITTALTTSSKTPEFSPPEFTIADCTCQLASASYELTLPSGQPAGPQIEARVSVPTTAPAGETIQFSATVSVAHGSGSGSRLTAAGGARAVVMAATPASPSPAPSPKSTAAASSSRGSTSGGSSSGGLAPDGSAPGDLGRTASSALGTAGGLGATLPGGVGVALPSGAGAAALPIGALPTIGASGSGGTVNVPAGSAANLFPQITPSSAPSHAVKTHGAQPGQEAVAAAASSPISLTGTQIGAQIIGLIVLLLGVAVVAVGVSVRKVQAAAKPST